MQFILVSYCKQNFILPRDNVPFLHSIFCGAAPGKHTV